MRKVLAFALTLCFGLCVIGCGDAKKAPEKKAGDKAATTEKTPEKTPEKK